jgi:hypothetical protein
MSELEHSPCREEVLRAEIERLRETVLERMREEAVLKVKIERLRELLKGALHHVTTEGDDTLAFEIRLGLEKKT